MKKALLITVLVTTLFCLSLNSCKAPQFFVGMSEMEFQKHNRSAQVVEASQKRTVYKQINYPFGAPAKVKFFYFVDGKLVQMDEGVRRADVTIETHRN
ncbi:MAG: hypothetical protein JWP78_3729 [Mucilaginibacter sp.]|nr:hypothetical protein [Mucilaginibacter sp.]